MGRLAGCLWKSPLENNHCVGLVGGASPCPPGLFPDPPGMGMPGLPNFHPRCRPSRVSANRRANLALGVWQGKPCTPISFSALCWRLGHTPLRIELAARCKIRPRAEPVAARGRAGSPIFIIGGVLALVTPPLGNNVFFARTGVRDPSPVVDRLGAWPRAAGLSVVPKSGGSG
jgi:hypothetical protein